MIPVRKSTMHEIHVLLNKDDIDLDCKWFQTGQLARMTSKKLLAKASSINEQQGLSLGRTEIAETIEQVRVEQSAKRNRVALPIPTNINTNGVAPSVITRYTAKIAQMEGVLLHKQ